MTESVKKKTVIPAHLHRPIRKAITSYLMLSISNFKKSYGRVTALTIDHLQLSPGIYWLRGANGAGKTSLLKCIAGIDEFQGTITLAKNNLDLKKQPLIYRRLVNFAEAEPLYPEFLTGQEMINLFASAKGSTQDQCNAYLSRMEMTEYIDEAIGTYSSGMLKKLSLVLAFIGKPELILLDEPLNALDDNAHATLLQWIKQKHEQESVSFLLSSHQTIESKGTFSPTEIWIKDRTLIVEV